jgi:hypothetical protein
MTEGELGWDEDGEPLLVIPVAVTSPAAVGLGHTSAARTVAARRRCRNPVSALGRSAILSNHLFLQGFQISTRKPPTTRNLALLQVRSVSFRSSLSTGLPDLPAKPRGMTAGARGQQAGCKATAAMLIWLTIFVLCWDGQYDGAIRIP